MKKMFVGGLPWSYTDEQLAELFAPHGEVLSAHIATERGTGRSRGFGFVEMEDDHATAAQEALNGTEQGGRAIKVEFALSDEERAARPPREDRGGRSRFGRRNGGSYHRNNGDNDGYTGRSYSV